MKTPQNKYRPQNKYPQKNSNQNSKKRALALSSNFNTIQPNESNRPISSYGGGSKKKRSKIKNKR